jgi:hypothetical protein
VAYPDLAETETSMVPWSGIVFLAACFGLALGREHFLHIPASLFLSSIHFSYIRKTTTTMIRERLRALGRRHCRPHQRLPLSVVEEKFSHGA